MLWRLFNSGKGIDRYRHGEQPAWALVTGSSDGIGKGVAFELASRGFNVFIHGRNAEKLAGVKDELVHAFPDRSFAVIVADAGNVSPTQLESIVQQIEGHNLTVVVNNVAWTGGNYDSLQDTDYSVAEDAINVNIRFFTHLIRVLLPILSTREPALIINVSSLAGRYPIGYLSIYAASKAYMVGLSRALVQEFAVESRKIEVIVAEVHNAQSAGNKSTESWHTPSVKSMAESIVNSVGKVGSSVVVAPYWGHELMGKFMGLADVGKIATQHIVEHYKKSK